MKRLTILLAVMLNALWAMAQFSGSGSGTSTDPYLIYNPIQVAQITNAPTKCFKLMTDIDMTDFLGENYPTEGWYPISSFRGTIDGNGHTISGMYINRSSMSNVGFIANLNGGTVKNLTLVYSSIYGNSYVGGIAGSSTGTSIRTIDNCVVRVTNSINGYSYIGGLIGNGLPDAKSPNTLKINNSSFDGKISSSSDACDYVGGIVGATDKASITACTVFGNLLANAKHTGGICGYERGKVSSSYTSCKFYGTIKGKQYTGGILGFSSGWSKVSNGYVSASMTGQDDTGGICGYVGANNSIESSLFKGNINGSSRVGGICGHIEYDSSTLTTCVSISEISGGSYIGGIAGETECNIDDCLFNGLVSGDSYVAGISGSCKYISNLRRVSRCVVISPLIAGNNYVAGIVGEGNASSNYAIVDRVRASKSQVHGIANSSTSNEKNYALTTLELIRDNVLAIDRTSSLDGQSIGKAMLKLQATYVANGFDFEKLWTIQETECYPYFKTQTAPPYITSTLVSGATVISGQTVDNGKVYLALNGNKSYNSLTSTNQQWNYTASSLIGGSTLKAYAEAEGLYPSCITYEKVKYEGKGTMEEPFVIKNADELANINFNGYSKLMTDIDLTDWIAANNPNTGWIPSADNQKLILDGQHHTISGLWTQSSKKATGLFGVLETGSKIENLNVTIPSGKSVSSSGEMTGALVGYMLGGSVTNCKVEGSVSGTYYVGGILGYAVSGHILNSSFTGNIASTTINSRVGGLVGHMLETGTIQKSKSSIEINVTGDGSRVGGVAGENAKGNITMCYSEGTVTSTGASSYTGGLVGINQSEGTIDNCYSIAKTNGTQYTGGLVGYSYGSIDKTYALGDIYGVSYAGGVVGELDGTSATISNSVAMNNRIVLTAASSWAGRVLGGYKNSAAEPALNNYALKTMQVSLNDVPKNIYDDPVEGIAKTEAELKSAATYTALGWDMTDTWTIEEGTSYPVLEWMTAPEDKPTDIAVTNITLSKSVLELKISESAVLTAAVLPEDATNKNVTWTSSNPEVATVENGVVTAVAEGNAVITVKAADGSNKAATCNVTVVQESSDDPDTDISSLANTIYVNNLEVNRSETVELSIKLKNSTMDISAFSFNLILPEGFAVTKVSRGERVKVKDDDEEFIFSFNNSDKDGVRYVQCYTMQDAVLSGKDGEVAKITISLPSDVKAGNYPIIINHSEVAYSSTNEIHETVKSTLTIKDYIVGDANGDGIISITDVSTIASYLLGGSPAGFNANAADANKDGTVSITDVSTLASLLLGK